MAKKYVARIVKAAGAEWNEYASEADDALNSAMQPLRNLEGDSAYGKKAVEWQKAVKAIISDISKATSKFGHGDTPA